MGSVSVLLINVSVHFVVRRVDAFSTFRRKTVRLKLLLSHFRITALLIAALTLSGCSASAQTKNDASEREPVTLTLATGFNESHSNNEGLWMFIDNLQQNAPWITIDYKGGPELMAPDVMIEGVSSGIFDMASLPGDYYVDQLPAMEVPRFTPYSPMEERELGITEIYDEIHREQLGVTYLGHTVSGMPQVLLVDSPITEANLQGKSLRTSSATSSLVHSINGIPVDLPGDEVYTGLERGVVSGATWSAVGPSSLGLQDVVDYHTAPRLYESLANLTMNEQVWEELGSDTQEALSSTMAETEAEIFEHYLKTAVAETQEWEEAGVQETTLAPDDAQQFLELAYYDDWQRLDWESIIETTPAAADLKEAYEDGIYGDLSDAVPGGSTIARSQELIEDLEEES